MQEERLNDLICQLLVEWPKEEVTIPSSLVDKKKLFRALCNIRPPRPVPTSFLKVQDAYLQEELRRRGVIPVSDLTPLPSGLFLWQGDITCLQADAIVNAANSCMLGCFVPCHRCIDNGIHTYAGVQLRLACQEIMRRLPGEMEPGGAVITPAFNLPSRYVLHTVGPIVDDEPTEQDCAALASCYRSCLKLAEKKHIRSLAFCCISTGEYRFPHQLAAQIAVRTVKEFQAAAQTQMKVIFNVYQPRDYAIYQKLLG